MHNPYSFVSVDVIIWNGIICQYGSVCHLIKDGDELSKASELDISTYKTKNL